MKVLSALALLLPTSALAQAYQCTPPSRVAPTLPPKPDGPVRRVAIARYTLAVSWSPEFCRGDRRSMQCSGANGRFGFVLHGLWPEARRGPPPQWCGMTPRPSPDLIRRSLCMTPVPHLIEHEWAKHGSCMVRTPDAYYRTAGILWRSLRWPDADRLSRQENLTVGDLRRAFVLANRDWKAAQVGVAVSRTGWLRELRLCYGRDFMPQACPRDGLGPPDSAPLKIWRGL
ncbi:MAG TPA: ribonuclease T [Novosphingobium sp.]